MIKIVECRIKNLDLTFQFDKNCATIIGANGTGKTSVINAIELACNGLASDIGGRADAKSPVMLQDIAPDNGHAFSRVTFDDGYVASWEYTKGKIQHDSDRPVWMVYADVADSLIGSREKFVEFLLKRIVPREAAATIQMTPPDDFALLEAWAMLRSLSSSENPLGQLFDMRAGAQDLARRHGATSKERQITAKVLADYSETLEADFIMNVERSAEEAQASARRFSAVADYCTETMARLVAQLKERICFAVNRFDVNFDFEIRGKSIFTGIRNESGRLLPAASGGQRTVMAAAVAAAAAERYDGHSLIVPNDRALDHKYARRLLGVLADSTAQSIVPLVYAPRGRPMADVDVHLLETSEDVRD